MLKQNELISIADSDGVLVKTVERDYVMSHIVSTIGDQNIADGLEFKGGTSLRLCHFRDYRYSADIDLNLTNGLPMTDALNGIAQALEEVKDLLGVPHLRLSEDSKHIEFVGPRGQARPEKIKLDISEDELTGGAVERLPIILRYDDQRPGVGLPTYSLVEVASEKFRCILQRLQCRDLYDLHRLLVDGHVNSEQAWIRFGEKAEHKDLDPNGFRQKFDTQLDKYRQRWEDEMSQYTHDVTEFRTVERQVRRELKPILT